ncbi:MAG TPA: YdeI/OmpD-associated family protein [Chloroflexia bacterium]|nr:YdeI/OmpD-associated family protein [Chloroflexia bacterium]
METENSNQLERYYASNRQEWRQWLEEHYAASPGIWLIYYKKESGKPRVGYDEAVEEALCFGWIDSRPNALDDERYMQLFTPRKPKSPWSRLNKQRVEKLLEQGLMRPAGLLSIENSKKDGSWNAYDAIEDLTVPEDLQVALTAGDKALKNFEAFSNTNKKQILWWIESAKRPETRARRIEQIVASAEQNKNPLQYTPKNKP